eukprot:m.164326 g.164326  ORF g.164326 m.164326 type:complete len:175 (-) comp12406_c0_seq1:1313-1837(-)
MSAAAAAAQRKLDEIDESGVDRSYYHGTIDRDTAVKRLQERNLDGAFLLRQSSSQAGAYTITLQAKGEIKHIRVTNTPDGKFTLGKSKTEYDSIWDLIEAQLDQKLTSTSGSHEVQLIYPLEAPHQAIAPDLLSRANEAGMGDLPDDVMAFMTGSVDVAELAARRKAALAAQGK